MVGRTEKLLKKNLLKFCKELIGEKKIEIGQEIIKFVKKTLNLAIK